MEPVACAGSGASTGCVRGPWRAGSLGCVAPALVAVFAANHPAACRGQPRAIAAPPTIEYRVALEEAAPGRVLRVSLSAAGLESGPESMRLHLDSWGGWTGDGGYIGDLATDPPVDRDRNEPTEFTIRPPADWDGRLAVSYAIPVRRIGPGGEGGGLLPWCDDVNVGAFTINILMDIRRGERPVGAERRVTFVAPEGRTVFTGWGGVSRAVRFDHPIDNAPVVIGNTSGSASADAEGIHYEVIQFGPGDDRTAAVLHAARSVVPAYARHSGRAPDEPVRIVLLDTATGSTHTDHGCMLGYRPAEDARGLTPRFTHVLAHELFHDWLGAGGFVAGSESITWFHEGFTDYLSLWHIAGAGLVDRGWFADRIAAIEAEARGSSALGTVAFAETAGGWRDDMGPRETLAYRGGAILAFGADVELRRAGRPGLMQLVADLARTTDGEATLDDVRGWMEAHGLADFYRRYVLEPALPDGVAMLKSIGFEALEAETELTYLGIRLGPGPDIGRVVEIDPEGPAGAAGIGPGDTIRGYFPTRGGRPRIAEFVDTPFRFGLDRIEPGVPGAYLDVVRAGVERQVPITPRLIPGGLTSRHRADEVKTAPFFRYEPPG